MEPKQYRPLQATMLVSKHMNAHWRAHIHVHMRTHTPAYLPTYTHTHPLQAHTNTYRQIHKQANTYLHQVRLGLLDLLCQWPLQLLLRLCGRRITPRHLRTHTEAEARGK